MKTKAFGIFEGGGAKGIAHAGALKAAEEIFEFTGVAGTSAGAIVAALVAAGYTSEEIYSPDGKESLLGIDLVDLLDEAEWSLVKSLRDELENKTRDGASVSSLYFNAMIIVIVFAVAVIVCIQVGLSFALNIVLFAIFSMLAISLLKLSAYAAISFFPQPCSWLYRWIMLHLTVIRHRKLVLRISSRGGALSTDKFRDWLDDRLKEKLRSERGDFKPTGAGDRISFGDLPIALKIIAAHPQRRAMRVFASPFDNGIAVADAVCASISIPVVFTPKEIEGARFVDGGIMSNFPAWVFDEERKSSPPFTPTIGFRLVDEAGEFIEQNGQFNVIRHLKEVGYSALFGDSQLETRNVATLWELLLRTRIGVLEFDLTREKKDDAFNAAFRHAKNGLVGVTFRPSDEKMGQVLKMVERAIRGDIHHQGHLRVSVMLPTDNSTLQTVYSINMDDALDTDDRLTLGKHQGASGLCWRELQPVLCDLEDAEDNYADEWKMDKYQQRLVRPLLKTLLSVPLFCDDGTIEESRFVGVLNIDSDDDLIFQFSKLIAEGEYGILEECASMVAERLTTWRIV